MAGRATYTTAEKARVYVVLTANEYNVKRTARETGTPENTVRRWRDEWKKNGPPDQDKVDQAATKFLNEAREVREEALTLLRTKLPDARPAELITIIGVLDDKITRASALEQKQKVDVVHHLPAADELKELLGGFVQGAIQAARKRQEEIVDYEIIEQKALLPA